MDSGDGVQQPPQLPLLLLPKPKITKATIISHGHLPPYPIPHVILLSVPLSPNPLLPTVANNLRANCRLTRA